MIKIKTLLLCSATVSLVGFTAHAENSLSGPRYAPRPAISNQNYTAQNHAEDHMDTKRYNEYEQREPCQKYRRLPRNYVDPCLRPPEEMEEEAVLADVKVKTTTVAETKKQTLRPIVNSYTILFDHDKSNIRANEIATLDKISREVERFDPEQITVTGYTDSSGAAVYNQTLSRQREQAVSKALLERGLENSTIERDARGEYNQAVTTPDDTKNQENRRVVVDFRR